MKVLQITNKFPYPLHDGYAWAVESVAKGLQEAGAEIDLFSLNTNKHFAQKEIVQELRSLNRYGAIFTAKIQSKESIVGAVAHRLFGSGSYYIKRFYNADVEDQLQEVVAQEGYDVVLLEGLYVALYIKAIRTLFGTRVKIVLRAHNVESQLRTRELSLLKKGIKKNFIQKEIKLLKIFEQETCQEVDLIVPVSNRDRDMFRALGVDTDIVVIPIGISTKVQNLSTLSEKRESETLQMGFIGSLDWPSNCAGLEWFLEEVWTKVVANNEDVELKIAGSGASKLSRPEQYAKVEFLGRVESSEEFMQSIDILIVPLLTGSGTRVKIIEAMSLGTPVMSTNLGAEGLNVDHLKNIWMDDDPQLWIEFAIATAKDLSPIRKMGLNGRRFVEDNCNIEKLGTELLYALRAI